VRGRVQGCRANSLTALVTLRQGSLAIGPDLPVQSDSVLTGPSRRVFHLLAVLWLAANGVFWWWWLQPDRMGSPWLYGVFTLAWAYEASFLPTMYLYFVGQMRHPHPLQAPAGLKVALVTLCVPSQETLAVIVGQLEALSRVSYPHESWILDEEADAAIRAAAARLGVRYFTRQGDDRYNLAVPPLPGQDEGGQCQRLAGRARAPLRRLCPVRY